VLNAIVGVGVLGVQLLIAMVVLLVVPDRFSDAPWFAVAWCVELALAGFAIQWFCPGAYLVASMSMVLGMLLIRWRFVGPELSASSRRTLLVAFGAIALGESFALLKRLLRYRAASEAAS